MIFQDLLKKSKHVIYANDFHVCELCFAKLRDETKESPAECMRKLRGKLTGKPVFSPIKISSTDIVVCKDCLDKEYKILQDLTTNDEPKEEPVKEEPTDEDKE